MKSERGIPLDLQVEDRVRMAQTGREELHGTVTRVTRQPNGVHTYRVIWDDGITGIAYLARDLRRVK